MQQASWRLGPVCTPPLHACPASPSSDPVSMENLPKYVHIYIASSSSCSRQHASASRYCPSGRCVVRPADCQPPLAAVLPLSSSALAVPLWAMPRPNVHRLPRIIPSVAPSSGPCPSGASAFRLLTGHRRPSVTAVYLGLSISKRAWPCSLVQDCSVYLSFPETRDDLDICLVGRAELREPHHKLCFDLH